jgi:NADH-quinone oxidoreductase subunit N
LVAYSVTILGSFGIVSILSDKERDAEGIIDYRGLFWRRPLLSVVFVAMLLSLAGIPLTAGFIGKYYVVASGVQSNLWLLAIMLVINSVIGLYYYLRIVATMLAYTKEEEEKFPALNPTFSLSGVVALTVLTLLVVWLGVLPSNMIQVVEGMVSSIS